MTSGPQFKTQSAYLPNLDGSVRSPAAEVAPAFSAWEALLDRPAELARSGNALVKM